MSKTSPAADEIAEVSRGLVESALHWLGRAIDSFTSREQEFDLTLLYSAISFEVFAKSLVIHLDWEQAFSSVTKADFERLKSGKAHTIGIPKAIERLREVLGVDCTTELKLFEKLSSHRDKIVHFHHPDLDTSEVRNQVATEMLQAWGGLLSIKKKCVFKDLFAEFEEEFRGIEQESLRLDAYLEAQEKRIHEELVGHSRFEECSFCRKQTFDYASSTCQLCGIREATHADCMDGEFGAENTECPKCGGYDTVMPLDEGGGRCKECKVYFELFGVCDHCGASYVRDERESDEIPNEDRHSTAFSGCGQNGCRGALGRAMEQD